MFPVLKTHILTPADLSPLEGVYMQLESCFPLTTVGKDSFFLLLGGTLVSIVVPCGLFVVQKIYCYLWDCATTCLLGE